MTLVRTVIRVSLFVYRVLESVVFVVVVMRSCALCRSGARTGTARWEQ